MFSKEELKIIHANTIYRLTNDKLIFEREKALSKSVFDKLSQTLTNDTPPPTETPIEELGKNDSVFCIANGDCVTEGKTYFVTRNYGDGIAIIDDERDEHDYDWSEAKQLFRTSPPQTETPIPKITNYEKPTSYSGSASGINRAELLEVVKSVAVYYSDAAKCVNYAKALINEVDKEVENGK